MSHVSPVAPTEKIVTVMRLPRVEFLRHIDEFIFLHLRAMKYEPVTFSHRRSLWRSNANHPRFTCFAAIEHKKDQYPDPNNLEQRFVGVCYGFQGSKGTWWHEQVKKGLVDEGVPEEEIAEIMQEYFELAEIHVHPKFQGIGLGRHMLTELIDIIPKRRAMLSTPEVEDENNRAWNLYRSMGFTDLLRNFKFNGDDRPFGILTREVDPAPPEVLISNTLTFRGIYEPS